MSLASDDILWNVEVTDDCWSPEICRLALRWGGGVLAGVTMFVLDNLARRRRGLCLTWLCPIRQSVALLSALSALSTPSNWNWRRRRNRRNQLRKVQIEKIVQSIAWALSSHSVPILCLVGDLLTTTRWWPAPGAAPRQLKLSINPYGHFETSRRFVDSSSIDQDAPSGWCSEMDAAWSDQRMRHLSRDRPNKFHGSCCRWTLWSCVFLPGPVPGFPVSQ